jgi:predicted transcriptional regulator
LKKQGGFYKTTEDGNDFLRKFEKLLERLDG